VKKIAVIPTLLTLCNAICGFAAIAYAGKVGQMGSSAAADSYYLALSGWLIVAAMIFDALDGYVARLARTASSFGGELDSLCDVISFGVAPAFLVLRLGPDWERPTLHKILAVIATLYAVCAILRLARFNVENAPDVNGHKRFRGLPSPAAAGCLASLAILYGSLGEKWPAFDAALLKSAIQAWATIGALMVALLMVSRVSYPHVTKQVFRGRRHFNHLLQIILAGCIIVLMQELALVLLFWSYTLGIFLRSVWIRGTRRQALPAGIEEVVPH